jgi:hypothetical protein
MSLTMWNKFDQLRSENISGYQNDDSRTIQASNKLIYEKGDRGK